MGVEKQPNPQKLAAVIYLRTARPLQLGDFATEFREEWPGLPLTSEGHSGNVAHFGVPDYHFAVELRYAAVPLEVTQSALPSRHWPEAEKDLVRHVAHLIVAVPAEPPVALRAALDLTKILVALLSVTDAIGVCWLNASVRNGSVVHPTEDFIAIARETLDVGLPPLMLWIAVHWKPEEHVIHTTGMLQFGAPEILLAQQTQPSPEMVEYLFDVAHYVLTAGKEILNGETMDGPKGILRIEVLSGTDDPSRRAIILVPVRSN